MKFEPRFINLEDKSNIMIILGQNPGNVRKAVTERLAFHGNRTGDFIESIVADMKDVYLTNICNYHDMTACALAEGCHELIEFINKFKPRVIVALGKITKKHLEKLNISGQVDIHYIDHPSFVLRFNKDKQQFIKTLKSMEKPKKEELTHSFKMKNKTVLKGKYLKDYYYKKNDTTYMQMLAENGKKYLINPKNVTELKKK